MWLVISDSYNKEPYLYKGHISTNILLIVCIWCVNDSYGYQASRKGEKWQRKADII